MGVSSQKVGSLEGKGLRLGALSTVARPILAKRVGDGRQGGLQARPADGFPEARAFRKSLFLRDLRVGRHRKSPTVLEENLKWEI
jgi:hypothetical protein